MLAYFCRRFLIGFLVRLMEQLIFRHDVRQKMEGFDEAVKLHQVIQTRI